MRTKNFATDNLYEKVLRVIDEEGEHIVLRCLPNRLIEMIELIGVSSVCRLASRFGGTRLIFSHRTGTKRAIADTIGPAAAAKLAEHYGVEEVPMPRAHRLETFLKHRDIVHLRKQGATVRNLALQFRLTERRIFQILAAERQLTPETS